jgi:hypothetical protein
MILVPVLDFEGQGIEFADGLHGSEGLEVCLDLIPLFGVLLCDDGSLRVGIVRGDVVFELEGNCFFRMLGDLVQEYGVGLVGEGVTAWFDDESGVEITVGDVAFDAIEVGQDEAQRLDGAVEALDVQNLGLLGRAFDGEHFERADLGQNIDPAGVEVAGDAGLLR